MSQILTHCAQCRYFARSGTEGSCRRHAPDASGHPFEVARWPETRATDACGEGQPTRHGDAAALPTCQACVFWHRPGIGIDPTQRGDHLRIWWQEAGYCRRNAPRPSIDIGHHGYWRVTHAAASCGEGRSA